MLSDLNGACAVVSRLLVIKVASWPEPEKRANVVRATLAPGRVISSAFPRGFCTSARRVASSLEHEHFDERSSFKRAVGSSLLQQVRTTRTQVHSRLFRSRSSADVLMPRQRQPIRALNWR
jgi:hypothetical protein